VFPSSGRLCTSSNVQCFVCIGMAISTGSSAKGVVRACPRMHTRDAGYLIVLRRRIMALQRLAERTLGDYAESSAKLSD
jgi:hypothetical protein